MAIDNHQRGNETDREREGEKELNEPVPCALFLQPVGPASKAASLIWWPSRRNGGAIDDNSVDLMPVVLTISIVCCTKLPNCSICWADRIQFSIVIVITIALGYCHLVGPLWSYCASEVKKDSTPLPKTNRLLSLTSFKNPRGPEVGQSSWASRSCTRIQVCWHQLSESWFSWYSRQYKSANGI